MRLAALLICTTSFAAPLFTLPDDVIPKKYTVDLTIDPAQPAFRGEVRIDVELKKSIAEIWLKAKDITPSEASVNGEKARVKVSGGEFLGLNIDSPVGPGRASISIRYEGKLDENSVVGPYRKKVGDDWYVFTTFTPIDARRAFPCFDEPRFKAPWEMTIHVPAADKGLRQRTRSCAKPMNPDGMKAIHFADHGAAAGRGGRLRGRAVRCLSKARQRVTARRFA